MIDPVVRSALQLIKSRAAQARIDFWQVLEVGLEVKVALDAVDKLPVGTPAPPVIIPDGPGYVYVVEVKKSTSGEYATAALPTQAAPTPPPPPPPQEDLELRRVNDVNPLEVVALELWLALAIKGNTALAHEVVDVGLRVHHYWSFLPLDPTQIRPEQSVLLQQYLEDFRRLVAQGNAALNTGYKV